MCVMSDLAWQPLIQFLTMARKSHIIIIIIIIIIIKKAEVKPCLLPALYFFGTLKDGGCC